MFRKNVAGQVIHFQGVDSATGGIKSGVTWTVRRCIDGTFAAGGGTVTEDGTTGFYKYAMSQADTNGNNIGFNFTGTGAIPQTVNIITTAADPTDAVRLGLTALPNANAEAAGGLYTRGTGAGQINQPADGIVDANAVRLGGTTQTGRDIGASVLLSSGTGAGQLDFTSGVVKANLAQILGTALTETAGQIAAAFKKFFDKASPTGTVNSLPDAVPGAAGGLLVDDVWTDARAAKLDNLDATISSRGTGTALDAAGVRSAVGLASASLDTQLGAIDDFLDTEIAAIKSKTDNLPASPAAVGSPMTLEDDAITAAKIAADAIGSSELASSAVAEIQSGLSTLDAAGVRSAVGLASANLDSQLADVESKVDDLETRLGTPSDLGSGATVAANLMDIEGQTDNLPGIETKIDDIPTKEEIADRVLSAITSLDIPFPSNTTILDNFNRADEGPPPSADWTVGFSMALGGNTEPGHKVTSNQLQNVGNDVNQNWYNKEAGGPDCDYFITVANASTLISVGLAARLTEIDGFSSNGYYVQATGDDARSYSIQRIDGADIALLASGSESGVGSMTGDKYGIRCLGNNIELWADTGDGWQKKLSAVDSTYSGAGFPGIYTEANTSARLDDFGGGDIVFPTHGSLLFNAGAIADAVWNEDIVSDHQTDDTAGKKLSQALVLYEGN